MTEELLSDEQMDNQNRCRTMIDVAKSELATTISKKILDDDAKQAYFRGLLIKKAENETVTFLGEDISFIRGLLQRADDFNRINKVINRIKFKITDTKTEAEYDAYQHPLKGEDGTLDARKLLQWLLGEENTEAESVEESDTSSFPDYFQEVLDTDPKLLYWVREYKVTFDANENAFRFGELGLAMEGLPESGEEHIGTREQHRVRLKRKGYRLENDVDYKKLGLEKDRLYPEYSDYDKIIATLPGAGEGEKGKLFAKLMCMNGIYVTNANFNDDPEYAALRHFLASKRLRYGSNADYKDWFARGVRSL